MEPLVVFETEKLALEPVDTPPELPAPSTSGMPDSPVEAFAARAGTPAVPVPPPTAPCETSGLTGMLDRTREMLAVQTPEEAGGVETGSCYYVSGRFCRAASRGATDRTLYERVRRPDPVYS